MPWTNFHAHCHYCDGEAAPEDHIRQAIANHMPAFGFSSHAPMPFYAEWCMQENSKRNLNAYKAEINKLKTQYQSKIDIFTGLEIDYIPGQISPSDTQFADLDYRIGSVHHLVPANTTEVWTMDWTAENFADGLERYYSGDIRALVTHYYETIQAMVRTAAPEVIGHLDLVRKFNQDNRFFNEADDWYQKLMTDTLALISESDCIVEVNTGAIARGWLTTPYPNLFVLKQCRDMGIPIMLNADSHHPDNLIFAFDTTAERLLEVGYTELMQLTHAGWQPVPFNSNGIQTKTVYSRTV